MELMKLAYVQQCTESLLLPGRRQQHAHLAVHLANMQGRPHSSMAVATKLSMRSTTYLLHVLDRPILCSCHKALVKVENGDVNVEAGNPCPTWVPCIAAVLVGSIGCQRTTICWGCCC